MCFHLFIPSTDIRDSSGIRFIYENAPRQFNAGILLLGHQVDRLMIIPPSATNYGVTGVCSSECTSRVSVSDHDMSAEIHKDTIASGY